MAPQSRPPSMAIRSNPISLTLEDVYRWEDNPSLNHSCSVCGVTLNNPRAKKTCLGIHAVPCIRYHQTLFRIGRAHSCEACKNSNEQHDKRHREIGQLIGKIHELDGTDVSELDTTRDYGRNASRGVSSTPESESTDEQESTAPKTKPSEKPLLSLNIPDNMNMSGFSPSAIASPFPASSKAKEIRLQKQAAKKAKNIDKMLERQRRRSTLTTTSREVTEGIHIAIHGQPKIPPTVDHEQSGKALLTEIDNFQRLQQQLFHNRENLSKSSGAARLRRSDSKRANPVARKKDGLDTDIITEIICNFGIKSPFNEGSKEIQRLLRELGSLIVLDIEIVANEAKETLRRKEGYWRYANKHTYNEMVRKNYLVNWETGEKLRELDTDDTQSDDSIESEVGGSDIEVSLEHIKDEANTMEQNMSTTHGESRINDVTKAQIDERDLILTKSPGTLTLSLAPMKEKLRPKTTEPVQTETDELNMSTQRETSEKEPLVIEPVTTHKRRTSKRYKRRSSVFPLQTLSTLPEKGHIDPKLQESKTNVYEMEDPKYEPQTVIPDSSEQLCTSSEIKDYQSERMQGESLDKGLKVGTESYSPTIIAEDQPKKHDPKKDWYRPQLLSNKCGVKINAQARALRDRLYEQAFASKRERPIRTSPVSNGGEQ